MSTCFLLSGLSGVGFPGGLRLCINIYVWERIIWRICKHSPGLGNDWLDFGGQRLRLFWPRISPVIATQYLRKALNERSQGKVVVMTGTNGEIRFCPLTRFKMCGWCCVSFCCCSCCCNRTFVVQLKSSVLLIEPRVTCFLVKSRHYQDRGLDCVRGGIRP